MPQSFALSDLVAPYFLKGQDLNAYHALLSVLRVVSHETCSDAFGMAIRGKAEFQGHLSIPGTNGALFEFTNDETDPPFDPAKAKPSFDLAETSVDFELFVPRAASTVIAGAVTALAGDTGFAPARTIIADWDTAPLDAPPSDFPASAFTLDLMVNAPRYRPGWLWPAKMTDDGLLVPDTTFKEVVITLPRLRFQLAQDVGGDGKVHFELLSLGVQGLDDPTDIRSAEFITMTPSYATISDSSVGIGFRSATLDLSTESTPPDVLSRIGVGDDWTGLYLPEARFFVGGGGTGLAFEIGAKDFLIGFDINGGISGDFEAALINQGGGDLKVGARFFDDEGRSFGFIHRTDTTADAVLPPVTRMVVDIEGGRVPYTSTVVIDGASGSGRLFGVDLSANPKRVITVTVSDSTAGTPRSTSLTINVQRGDPRLIIVQPGTDAEPAKPAEIATDAGADPVIVTREQNDRFVTLTTSPADSGMVWSVDGGADSTPQPNLTVEVLAGTPRTVKAGTPATTVAPVEVYFYFDCPPVPGSGAEEPQILGSVALGDLAWSTAALGRLPSDHREPGGGRPFITGEQAKTLALVPSGSTLVIHGQASFENDDTDSKLEYNYLLARRRAIAAHALLAQAYGTRFTLQIDPAPKDMHAYAGLAAWRADWITHGAPGDRGWWKASVDLPAGLNRAARSAQAVLTRPPSAGGTPTEITVLDPPVPAPPDTPSWFRSAKLKVRIIESTIVAIEIDGEIDIQTAAEDKLRNTGQVDGVTPDKVRTLEAGQPLAPDNPGDGITEFRFLIQQNETTREMTISFSAGANPADNDGLIAIGWLPGEDRAPRSFWRNLLGSYLSFWPLLVQSVNRDIGSPVDAAITGAELAIPPIIAAIPWFRTERIILFGIEYLGRWQVAGSEGNLFFDIETDWSVAIPSENNPLIQIGPDPGIKIRYKAIGLHLADIDANGAPIQRYDFRPVFDSSRGYTLDLSGASGVAVRSPFDRILKVMGARISRVNPVTLEAEIGVAVDFGIVTFDRMGIRAYLDGDKPIEITDIGAHVDIPGALVGQGYLEISDNLIGGQLDMTVRPIGLRVSGSLEIANISAADGGPATGIYIGLDLLLPVGIPLANTGLGIFGFRGLFGMHYERTPIGTGMAVPSLEWLKKTEGRPNLLVNNGVKLWQPKIDHWAFGVGTLIGTMEGGFVLNLDGTLLLELPGPSVLIAMNARYLSPPPSIKEAGAAGGILAVIEITPDHIAIGIYATYEIKRLIEIKVPVEAFFATGDLRNWHFYLGARPDIPGGPGPVTVRVLGIVDGTGYLMIRGDGLPAYHEGNHDLPAITGFGIGIGAGASFVWGDTDIGLYLKVSGGFDAVVGFDPLMIAGQIYVAGELRLFIASVGADASLTVIVREQPGNDFPPPIAVFVDGKACGHIDLFLFEISDCVSISFGSKGDEPAVPPLASKLSLKSHSPALVLGTGVDRPIDGSLGDAAETADTGMPAGNLPAVPIDAIPVIGLAGTPGIAGATFFGEAIDPPPNLPLDGLTERGGEKYQYTLKSVALERIAADGSVLPDTVIGTDRPCRWWTTQGATGDPSGAQLALLTYDLDPAPKALETSDTRTQTINDRWGSICEDPAKPAAVLWTFRLEPLGPNADGWHLAGMPWPDAPGTRRSRPADSELYVHEQWRTGIAWLDAARGIMPATVIGGPVACRRSPIGRAAFADLVRIGGRGPVAKEASDTARAGWKPSLGDPVLDVFLGTGTGGLRIPDALYRKAKLAAAPKSARSQADVLNALSRGDAVSRQDVNRALNVLGGSYPSVAGDVRLCEAHVLQSPLLDDGTLQRFGDPGKAEQIRDGLKQAGIRHGPLDNVVMLETGAFTRLRALLYLPGLRDDIVVVFRILDKDGNELGGQQVTLADRVPPKVLPATWTDQSGPWAADIADLMALAAQSARLGRWLPVLVELGKFEKAARVEIGMKRRAVAADAAVMLLPYYVAAIELARLSEELRYDWDEQQITNERDVVTALVGGAATDSALLYPNSLYRCAVEWDAVRQSTTTARSATQYFWFRTDNAPPDRLDAFVLMTSPGDGERHYFAGEAPSIVFGVGDIDRLYAAYGKELKVRVQASSGHHPPGQAGGPSQLNIGAATLLNGGATVLSPFEEALVGVLDGKCIPIDGNRRRQTSVTLDIPLDIFTDYIVDIVAVPAGQEPTQFTPFIYRRRFSTGGYANLAEFGASLAGPLPGHKALPANAVVDNLARFATQAPIGQELDDALRAAGMDVEAAPRASKVTVLWEPGPDGAQPMALLIDSEEPLWRSRAYPQKVPDATSLPGTSRWQMVDKDWMSFEVEASTVAVAQGHPIPAAGGQRALVLLQPGARGKRIALELVRTAFPEPYLNIAGERRIVIDIVLTHAPWEA